MTATITPRFADRMERVQPNAIGELLALGADPSIISFGGGYPDPDLFPAAELEAVFTEAIRAPGGQAMQYAPSDGLPRLREQVAELMRADGTPCAASDVLILQGSQQGLDFAARMLVNPGEGIVTEDPTFLGAIVAFDPARPTYVPVPVDAEGMRVDLLEETLDRTPDVRMIYTIPEFQNPTGATLSLPRRERLMELARAHDLVVVEDAAYRQIRFAGDPLPTLKSMDTDGRVIHLGSFSKVLVPGMRLGWAVAAPPLLDRMKLLKVAADTQTATLNMTAASLWLERYDLAAHVARLRAAYRRKKDVMLDAMRRHFPQEVEVTDPEGGLFLWARFPDSFDATAFMRDTGLPEARVAYVPGGSFFPVAPRPNHARFNFSGQSEARIVEGIAALGAALKAHAEVTP
jgi:DNA-binding transcriptional MocR family regulator